MALRDSIISICPPWLAKNNGEKMMYALGTLLDMQISKVQAIMFARLPLKAKDMCPTALGYIGADRNLIRGLNESDEAYARRCAKAMTIWRVAGLSRAILAGAVSSIYPYTPPVELINNTADGYTIFDKYAENADINLPCEHHMVSDNFDFDGATSSIYYRFFVVIYMNSDTVKWASPINIGDGYIGDTDKCIGFDNPPEIFRNIRQIIQQFMSANSICYPIVSFNYDLFDYTSSATYPTDGSWVNYSKYDSGENAFVPARYDDCRYLEPFYATTTIQA